MACAYSTDKSGIFVSSTVLALETFYQRCWLPSTPVGAEKSNEKTWTFIATRTFHELRSIIWKLQLKNTIHWWAWTRRPHLKWNTEISSMEKLHQRQLFSITRTPRVVCSFRFRNAKNMVSSIGSTRCQQPFDIHHFQWMVPICKNISNRYIYLNGQLNDDGLFITVILSACRPGVPLFRDALPEQTSRVRLPISLHIHITHCSIACVCEFNHSIARHCSVVPRPSVRRRQRTDTNVKISIIYQKSKLEN